MAPLAPLDFSHELYTIHGGQHQVANNNLHNERTQKRQHMLGVREDEGIISCMLEVERQQLAGI